MFFFNRRKDISAVAMAHLIYETSKSYSTSIFNLMDKVGIVYDTLEVQINILLINLELNRFYLYKDNKKNCVDCALDEAYDLFFYEHDKIDRNLIVKYKDNILNHFQQFFSSKNKNIAQETYIYNLLLNQLSVNSNIVDEMYVSEFKGFIKLWINNAYSINKTYSIVERDIDNKEQYIDFNF